MGEGGLYLRYWAGLLPLSTQQAWHSVPCSLSIPPRLCSVALLPVIVDYQPSKRGLSVLCRQLRTCVATLLATVEAFWVGEGRVSVTAPRNTGLIFFWQDQPDIHSHNWANSDNSLNI